MPGAKNEAFLCGIRELALLYRLATSGDRMSAPQLKQINTLIDAALGKSPRAARQYASRNPTPTPTPPQLETVDAIRARVLSQAQLEAIAKVQDGLLALRQLEDGINSLLSSHNLPIKEVLVHQVGDTWYQIEGLLFAHNCAAAKLRNGGLPLAVKAENRAAA